MGRRRIGEPQPLHLHHRLCGTAGHPARPQLLRQQRKGKKGFSVSQQAFTLRRGRGILESRPRVSKINSGSTMHGCSLMPGI